MKFSVTSYNAVAVWKWDTHTSSSEHKLYHYARSADPAASGGYGEYDDDDDDEEDDDVCGICRLAFESTCPDCKVPGDDCPLIWGECTHVFHMHCLLKWIDTESSKGQCPMDRRPWATADRAPDRLPTTTTGEPVATVEPGPIPDSSASRTSPEVHFADTTVDLDASLGSEDGGGGDEGPGTGQDDEDDDEEEGMDVDQSDHPSSLRV